MESERDEKKASAVTSNLFDSARPLLDSAGVNGYESTMSAGKLYLALLWLLSSLPRQNLEHISRNLLCEAIGILEDGDKSEYAGLIR